MKLFKNYSLLFIFIGFSFHSIAQITIEGFTKDEKSNSLAYVSFFCKNQFVGMSNELGKFQIQIPDSLKFDTLKCKYLGYTPFVILLNEWSKSNEQTIVLKQSSIKLNDFIVKTKPHYTIGEVKFAGALTDKPKDNYFMKTGSIVGLFIKNEIPKIAFLKKAHFYITNCGFTHTKFRVHVYEANADGMPIKDLLDSNYFANAVDGGNEWVTVDLTMEKIEFCNNGLVIAMEWLTNEKKLDVIYALDSIKTARVGPCLGGTWEFDANYALSFNNTWYKSHYPSSVKNFRKLNPMIKAEFDVVK